MKKIFVGARVAAQAASRLSLSVLAVIAFAAMVLAGCGTTGDAGSGAQAPAAQAGDPTEGYTGKGLSDKEIGLWWLEYARSLWREKLTSFLDEAVKSNQTISRDSLTTYCHSVDSNGVFDAADKGRVLRWKEGIAAADVFIFIIPDVRLALPEVSAVPKRERRQGYDIILVDRPRYSSNVKIGTSEADAITERLNEAIQNQNRANGIPVRVTSVAKELFLNMDDEARTPLTPKTIDIGENIAIEKGASSYIDSFIDLYNGGGKKAGSYSYSGGAWNMTLVF
jgi:hypothetical protein